MKLNQDKVPTNLEEAIQCIKDGLTQKDIEEIKRPRFVSCQAHFTVGMFIRNEWSLWDKDTILVQWFKKTYGIEHADDISSIILDCVCADIGGEPRKDKEMAKSFIEHWKQFANVNWDDGESHTFTLKINK